MRAISLAFCLLLIAAPAMACEFKSAAGSRVSFKGPENHRYAVIDGHRCSFTETTFTCGKRTTSYEPGADETLTWKGVLYTSTDHCSAGPE